MLLLWFILIVTVRPPSVCLRLLLYFVQDSQVAICWESVVLVASRLCCFNLFHLNCLCSLPVWLIVIVHPPSVCLRLLLCFVQDSLVAICWESVVLLAFRLCCFILFRLNCLCSLPVWCLGQNVEFDCGSLPYIYYSNLAPIGNVMLCATKQYSLHEKLFTC